MVMPFGGHVCERHLVWGRGGRRDRDRVRNRVRDRVRGRARGRARGRGRVSTCYPCRWPRRLQG